MGRPAGKNTSSVEQHCTPRPDAASCTLPHSSMQRAQAKECLSNWPLIWIDVRGCLRQPLGNIMFLTVFFVVVIFWSLQNLPLSRRLAAALQAAAPGATGAPRCRMSNRVC